jgi:hypothetical protein
MSKLETAPTPIHFERFVGRRNPDTPRPSSSASPWYGVYTNWNIRSMEPNSSYIPTTQLSNGYGMWKHGEFQIVQMELDFQPVTWRGQHCSSSWAPTQQRRLSRRPVSNSEVIFLYKVCLFEYWYCSISDRNSWMKSAVLVCNTIYCLRGGTSPSEVYPPDATWKPSWVLLAGGNSE